MGPYPLFGGGCFWLVFGLFLGVFWGFGVVFCLLWGVVWYCIATV